MSDSIFRFRKNVFLSRLQIENMSESDSESESEHESKSEGNTMD